MWTSSSGEGGGKEEEEDDVSIYFRMDAISLPGEKYGAQDWFVFKSGGGEVGGSTSPVFPRQPILPNSTCVAVDSFIYVIGGEDWEKHRSIPKRLCDVYYIDTLDPDSGWKKLAYSLNKPRARAHAFSVNGVIYVMGGYIEFINHSIITSVSPEICFSNMCPECGMLLGEGVVPLRFRDFNARKVGGWFELTDSKEVPTYCNGHAVFDEGKSIVLHSEGDPNLYGYDVEADSWEIYSKSSFVSGTHTSALVDGILYYLERSQPGILFGLDVSSPDNLPKKVKVIGLDEDDREKLYHDWIPQLKTFPDLEFWNGPVIPDSCLVSLGEAKLAAIWDPIIFIVRMSKVENETGGVDYVAHPVSRDELQYFPGARDFVAVNNTTGSVNRNCYKDHMNTAHPGTKINRTH